MIVAIVVSVALPRLLTGTRSPRTRQSRGPARSRPYPPFQVVVTVNDATASTSLLVESAATGHVVSTLAPPWHGAMWVDVSATADPTRFIVAAAPLASRVLPRPGCTR